MKKKFIIIYWRFYKFDGSKKFIGGVETYIENLAKLTTKLGFETIIYQCASNSFIIENLNYKVIGVKTCNVKYGDFNNLDQIYKEILKVLNIDSDIILFGTEDWSLKNVKCKNIAIQHGISWDKPIELLTKIKIFSNGIGEQIKRYILRRKALNSFRKSEFKVCVDYNFLNWYRTYYNSDEKIKVIPNCTEIVDKKDFITKIDKDNSIIKVLFARRFELFRGTRLMQEAIDQVLKVNKNIYFTLAGYGEDSLFLEEKFKNNKNVLFCEYTAEYAQAINFEHDISIIPSIGSEGTSFSVAEALGSGTAVIATDTGGITNMILNNYNGVLISPNAYELANSILDLANNNSKRKQLVINGYETANTTFSLQTWEKLWSDFIKKICNEELYN